MNDKLYLAPVKGVTDRVFREVFSSHFRGVDIAVAPFVNMSDSEKKIKDLAPGNNKGIKTIPQILTRSPEHFLSLKDKLTEAGCDEINWNLGCPFRMVIDRGEGAAMMQNPEAIDSFLDRIFKESVPRISVKMRLGMYKPDEILSVIPVLNRYVLHEVIIHARTADQMYGGDVNLNAFSEALKISEHSVIYNGDILHHKDIELLKEKFPDVKGWMIGRGLLVNPFLAEEIMNGVIEPDEIRLKRIRKFSDDILKGYISSLQSDAHVLDKMKGLWSYLSDFFEESRKIEKRIRKVSSVKHFIDESKRVFDSLPEIKTEAPSMLHIASL